MSGVLEVQLQTLTSTPTRSALPGAVEAVPRPGSAPASTNGRPEHELPAEYSQEQNRVFGICTCLKA